MSRRSKTIGKKLLSHATALAVMAAAPAEGRARASEPTPAFAPGEQSTYTVKYLGIEAGTAVITVGAPAPDGPEAWPIVAVARSGPLLAFFPVRDKLVTVVEPKSLRTLSQTLYADENHRRREHKFTMNYGSNTALIVRRQPGQPPTRATVAFTPGAQDLTAATFELRRRISRVGQTLTLPVFTGQHSFPMKATVLTRQRLETPLGEKEVFKVRIQTEFQGKFQSRRDMFAYLTTDGTHVPVRIEADFLLGTIVAELTDYKQGDALAAADLPAIHG